MQKSLSHHVQSQPREMDIKRKRRSEKKSAGGGVRVGCLWGQEMSPGATQVSDLLLYKSRHSDALLRVATMTQREKGE